MAKSVWIGDRYFASQAAAKDGVRAIWNAYEIGAPVTDERDIAFLTDLVEMHHDAKAKTGPGIDHFVVVNTSKDRNWRKPNRGIWIRHADGVEIEFSALKPIDGPGSPKSRLSGALANEARELTGGFREAAFAAGAVKCWVTGELIDDINDAEARHIDPSFGRFVDVFLNSVGLAVEDVELEDLQEPLQLPSGRRISGHRLKDRTLADAWLAYHREHMDGLRICSSNAPRTGNL